MYCTAVTGPIRPIIAGAAVGSSAVWPKRLWPLVTVSRFVPRALISASRPDSEDGGDARAPRRSPRRRSRCRARRAPARSLRGAQPHERDAREIGGPELRWGASVVGWLMVVDRAPRTGRRPTCVDRTHGASATIRPSSISIWRGRRSAISRSWVMTRIVVPTAVSSSRRARIAWLLTLSRLPVGSSARTIAGLPASARAIATRWRSPPESWVGRAAAAMREADLAERLVRALASLGERHAGVEQPVGDVVERALVLGQEELLEDEADARRAQRRELPVGHLAATSSPVMRTMPLVGRSSVPIRWSSVVLPEPDGPTIATSSPAWTAKLTPRSASTGGSLG